MNQNPFNLYDFLGYLIPGILFLFLFQMTGFYDIKILNILDNDFDLLDYTILIVIAYVCGHVLSIASSRTIEDYHIWLNGYPSKNLFIEAHIKKRKGTYLLIVTVIIFPLIMLDQFSRKIFSHTPKTLQKSLKRIVLKKLISYFKVIDKESAKEIKESGYLCNDLFRYVNHYANENNKEHTPKFLNYVALYGFSRSISLLFCILFDLELVLLIVNLLHKGKMPQPNMLLLIISLIACYIFYLSYGKFFRRYTQEVIMAFTANYNSTKVSPASINFQ